MRRALASLGNDEAGVTVIEFALLAPVLLVTMMGLFDFSYNIYAESMIEGAVQKAARDSTIEQFANNPAALDAKVRGAVLNIVPSADVTFERSAYSNYVDVGLAEDFSDTNLDGICNFGEPFVDYNGNGFWDEDRALLENGGARDAVLYEVTATYDRAFPLAGLLGFENTTSVAARTVLRNQPFNAQSEPTVTGNCPL